MDCRRGKTISYNDVGTFASYNRMVREIGAAGFAIGASQVGSPVGLMFGHYIVSKWRNLNQQKRAELHGIVEGDRRTGPLLVTIYDDAPREARDALRGLFMERLRNPYTENQPEKAAYAPKIGKEQKRVGSEKGGD